MIWRRVHAAILCGVYFLVLMPTASSLNCLVIRPGRGLVSEKCPNNSVACRMRIENNAIVWYEYSKLYDRNHLACILKGEYSRLSAGEASRHPDWCARKDRGTMRCWCAGNECNEATYIRRVYLAFIDAEQGDYGLSNDLSTYRLSTSPLPITGTEHPPTSLRPFFHTRIFAPPPTTINNYLYTNDYPPPKKTGSFWEATTMRGESSPTDTRLKVDNVHSATNNGINFADASTLFSLKMALVGVTAFTLFIVQIGYSI